MKSVLEILVITNNHKLLKFLQCDDQIRKIITGNRSNAIFSSGITPDERSKITSDHRIFVMAEYDDAPPSGSLISFQNEVEKKGARAFLYPWMSQSFRSFDELFAEAKKNFLEDLTAVYQQANA